MIIGLAFSMVSLALSILLLASTWKVFTKAGKPGWAALVPIYNLVVILEIARKPLWWLLLFLVPVANVVVAFIVHISLAERFGKGAGFGVGLAMLGFIFFPILGFGDARYQGPGDGTRAPMPVLVIVMIVLFASLPLLGIFAAVAIPAFMRYQSLAKTTEAEQLIRKLSDGALAYYHNPTQPGLAPVPKQLPSVSVGPTPPVGACCIQGGRCAPDPTLWDHPTWQALTFSIDDSHYYSYEYEVIDGGEAYVVRAIGDLDCDGVVSTFEMRGMVTEGGVQSSASILRVNRGE
jgi:hypothetical protein